MGHTLILEIPPRQGPYLKLFQVLLLAGLFNFCSGNRQVTRSVKEVAALSCDYNIPTNHLTNFRLYWQKGNEVVLTVISGQVSVWPDYLNRTILDMTNNLSIFILALRPSDTGTYTCIVQKYENGFYKRVHLALVDLSVQDFHDPIITDVGNTNTGIRKLNCSASGGFPEPHLSWLENGEKLTAIKPRVFQDPETELYTISSELHFNVTSNRTFVCLIQYGYKQVSKTFHWITTTPTTNFPVWVIISCVIAVLVFIVLIIGLWYSSHSCLQSHAERSTGRSRSDTVEVEKITPICTEAADTSG